MFALCLGTKNSSVKFCYAHEQRLRINLHNFRVIRADAAEGELVVLEYPYSAEFQCLAISGRWRRTKRVPAMLCRGCRLPDEYQHSRVDGAAVLLRASHCVALYMACLPATRPTATPDHSSLPPRPSRRNNCICPEGATSLAGPSRPSPSSSGLSSGMAPWWLAGGWRLVDGRPGGGEMRMGSGGAAGGPECGERGWDTLGWGWGVGGTHNSS